MGIYQLTCNTCNLSYVRQMSRNLKIRIQEHIRYIRSNNPHSVFPQHILKNQHEYGQMSSIMTFLKPLSSPRMLISYKKYYIQTLHLEGKLILEKYPGEPNLLFQMAINPQPPHTTWKDQSCLSLQPWHYSTLTTPILQHTANQGMYNFRFIILINTNNTLNYQSTNETHYTQENTMITTHKGSQLLILIEAHYQLQPSDKELHTEHTPLSTIILH